MADKDDRDETEGRATPPGDTEADANGSKDDAALAGNGDNQGPDEDAEQADGADQADEAAATDEAAKDDADQVGEAESARPSASMPKVESDPSTRSQKKAAAWGRPLVRLDSAWTKWEVFLCTVVLILEVIVLSMWVGLKGLSTAADGASKAGIVFRMLTGAIVLGGLGYLATRKQKKPLQRTASIGGIVIGVVTAKYWGNVGVDWASNMLNWFQQASTLTLFGGLRGLGTRLTLLLALLGGSLATAAGKHITIDLVTRYLRPTARLYVVVFGWLVTAFVCGVAGWGFFDHIAIDDFDTKAEASAGEKISHVTKGMGEHAFILRKQIKLDLKTLPHVVKGERYAEWMGGEEWNAWLRSEGFAERYGKEKAAVLEITPDMKRSPIVVVPEKGEPRGELIKSANLVFPIGLLVLVFRFVLLSLLALSGHFSIDFESHAEEFKRRAEERESESEEGGDDEKKKEQAS